MSIASIPAANTFFDIIAARWMQRDQPSASCGDGLIVVPNRRSVMQLSEAFLRCSDGASLLLPRIISYADLENVFEVFPAAGVVESAAHSDAMGALPPSCDPMRRMVALTALILGSRDAFSVRPGLDQAWTLAQALAELMDDAERDACDLAARLPEAAEDQYAAHWERSLQFLTIVTQFWPDFLAQNGVMNPVARQAALIRSKIRHWAQTPPEMHIWAIGFTDIATEVGAFLAAVIGLPNGCVVLPGLDQTLPEALWAQLPESHPQYGLKQILKAVKQPRAGVASWALDDQSLRNVPSARVALLRAALVPASGVAKWVEDRARVDLDGLFRLTCEDPQQEARAIAMILRDGLTQPGHRVALITPDRQIARRVSVQLLRYGIVADDSAGEPLMRTPAAVFLLLLAEAWAAALTPVTLLALLKHPFSAAGLTPGACRASARKLERLALRGPAPPPGFVGMRQRCRVDNFAEAALADRPDLPLDASLFLDKLEAILQPLMNLSQETIPKLITTLISTAESLATTPDQSGAQRLWAGEDGHALASHLIAILEHSALLGAHEVRGLPAFLAASMNGIAVVGQRVLRGREGGHLHPRVFILGLIEARLQKFDLTVVAGLEEGIWPPATEPGPWLSRPMRQTIGLRSPEYAIGAYAFDFVSASLSAPRVVLSQVARREGTPAVPSRWLVRLEAYLGGRLQKLPEHPARLWQAKLDQPDGAATPAQQPMPRPPVHLRPRRLSVTEIDKWLADPYAIYARHILKLRPLDVIDAPVGRAEIGVIVHEALAEWVKLLHADESSLTSLLLQKLARAPLRPAAKAWWRGRFVEVARGATRFQALRVCDAAVSWTERAGKLHFDAPGGRFELIARADRIDRDAIGRVSIIDYKTGRMPKRRDTDAGWASQLWLEAAIVAADGFEDIKVKNFLRLEYWRLSGQATADKIMTIAETDDADADGDNALMAEVAMRLERFKDWVAHYDNLQTPYRAQPRPKYAPAFDDYGQLARVREWRLAIGDDS